MRFTASISNDTKAADSKSSCASNCVIIRDMGLVFAFARNATAEMVIMELTKKYDADSAAVDIS